MKRKYINSILVGCALCAFSACTDVWDEHYQANKPIPGQESADKNLWELISADQDLEEFAALLQATGYHELLMQNRCYTVWAPADGSGFIDVTLLENASKEEIESYKKRIVENHIANFNHAASGIRDKEDRKNYEMIEMLNTKKYDFEGKKAGEYTFDGLDLQQENIVAKNGVLHKLDGYVSFAANIWETLGDEGLRTDELGLSELWNFLKKDFKSEFNPAASVQGPVVDGQVTWLDSSFTESCRWFGEIGWLDREDSSYTMYALTNRAWGEMYEMTKKYYAYPFGMKTLPAKGSMSAEQATDSIVKDLMVRNLVFSNTVNKKFFDGVKDTLISNYRYGYQIFENEEAHALSNGLVGEPFELSNGSLYIVDEVNYNPMSIWHDTLRVEGEFLSDADETRVGFKSVNKTMHIIHRDSLYHDSFSSHGVGVFEAFAGQYNPEFHFYVDNVLSAYYDIKLVLVPAKVIEPYDSTLFIKPNKFAARLYYNDGLSSKNVELRTEAGDSIFFSDPTKIDTIVLAKNFFVPVCEFDLKGLSGSMPQTRVFIESKIEFGSNRVPKENNGNDRDSTKWMYDNHFRIDQLIFEPVVDPTVE